MLTPLQNIPARVRVILYWVGYVLGVVSSLLSAVWVTVAASRPDVEMPLWLIIVQVVVTLLVTQLNLLAGSNVVDTSTVVTTAPKDGVTQVSTTVYESLSAEATAKEIQRLTGLRDQRGVVALDARMITAAGVMLVIGALVVTLFVISGALSF